MTEEQLIQRLIRLEGIVAEQQEQHERFMLFCSGIVATMQPPLHELARADATLHGVLDNGFMLTDAEMAELRMSYQKAAGKVAHAYARALLDYTDYQREGRA